MTCQTTGKTAHRKRSTAHRHAKELDRKARAGRQRNEVREGSEAYVYACEHCGGFHVATGRKTRSSRGQS